MLYLHKYSMMMHHYCTCCNATESLLCLFQEKIEDTNR